MHPLRGWGSKHAMPVISAGDDNVSGLSAKRRKNEGILKIAGKKTKERKDGDQSWERISSFIGVLGTVGV